MLLAIDVGNTNITVGAFDGERLVKLWRLATDLKKTADEMGVVLSTLVAKDAPDRKVDAAVYGSVVPALNPTVETAVSRFFGVAAIAVTTKSKIGVTLKVDHPSEVGVDRFVNALAVAKMYGAPAVVLDFGTATTFDCVSASGAYVGGAILLGPRTAAKALVEHTAQLPEVEIKKPKKVVGTNTVECIQAGLYYGYLGMIDRILEETIAEMKAKHARGKAIRVIATGGLAGLFAKDLPKVKGIVPDLTLQGLRLAYDAISGGRRARKFVTIS
ncbi:MAG: type III pantothenate kinase [Elusimicrobia bacterium]|nr:type III pantothenate kinase [Elusimicrobiota bacterium]